MPTLHLEQFLAFMLIILSSSKCAVACRLNVYKQFKEGQKRILVATDLVGRGIDIERVNIVINYDMPETDDKHGNGADTYLHRVRLYTLLNLCFGEIQHSLQLMIVARFVLA